MPRVISYIDGFNLYFGLKDKGWKRYYWLDPVQLSRLLLKENQTLEQCHYFTARIRANSNSQSLDRQNIWLDALATRPDLSIQFGHYLPKQVSCRECGAKWNSHEEKMTDVNIATQLLADAYAERFDTALIVSADSDLMPPIRLIKTLFPQKRCIVAFPPKRRSDQLKRTAHGTIVIGEDKLRHSLLPDRISTPSGYVIQRPKEWF